MDTGVKIEKLYRGSRINASAGNVTLASWMHESAEYYHSIQQSNEEFLDKFLVREETKTVRHTRREEFTSQWYEYEEEYSFNFFGLE